MSAFEGICPVHNVDDLVCGEAVRLEEELLRKDLTAAEAESVRLRGFCGGNGGWCEV